jgi:tRNA pseudouridine13 synthase
MLAMWKVVNRENLAEINKAIRDGRMRLAIPLIGYRQYMSEGVQGDIEHEVLEEEGISMQDFRVGVLPEISSKGELRGIMAPVIGLSYDCVSAGDAESLGSGVNLDFMLFRGSYATVVLREFMKARKPIEAGF